MGAPVSRLTSIRGDRDEEGNRTMTSVEVRLGSEQLKMLEFDREAYGDPSR